MANLISFKFTKGTKCPLSSNGAIANLSAFNGTTRTVKDNKILKRTTCPLKNLGY